MEILSLTNQKFRRETYPLLTMERSAAPGMLPGFHYFIEQKYGNETWYFLIDTGASSTIIDKVFAEKVLHLTSEPVAGEMKFQVSGVSFPAACIHCFFLDAESNYFCTDLQFFKASSELNIAGIIGSDVMDLLNASIDLQRRTITFHAQ